MAIYKYLTLLSDVGLNDDAVVYLKSVNKEYPIIPKMAVSILYLNISKKSILHLFLICDVVSNRNWNQNNKPNIKSLWIIKLLLFIFGILHNSIAKRKMKTNNIFIKLFIYINTRLFFHVRYDVTYSHYYDYM